MQTRNNQKKYHRKRWIIYGVIFLLLFHLYAKGQVLSCLEPFAWVVQPRDMLLMYPIDNYSVLNITHTELPTSNNKTLSLYLFDRHFIHSLPISSIVFPLSEHFSPTFRFYFFWSYATCLRTFQSAMYIRNNGCLQLTERCSLNLLLIWFWHLCCFLREI